MHARVFLLRHLGVRVHRARPPEDTWPLGILEVTDSLSNGQARGRRLVLRDSRSSPGNGTILELFLPQLVESDSPYLRFRGIEAVTTASGETAGMVQEWLVSVLR